MSIPVQDVEPTSRLSNTARQCIATIIHSQIPHTLTFDTTHSTAVLSGEFVIDFLYSAAQGLLRDSIT